MAYTPLTTLFASFAPAPRLPYSSASRSQQHLTTITSHAGRCKFRRMIQEGWDPWYRLCSSSRSWLFADRPTAALDLAPSSSHHPLPMSISLPKCIRGLSNSLSFVLLPEDKTAPPKGAAPRIRSTLWAWRTRPSLSAPRALPNWWKSSLYLVYSRSCILLYFLCLPTRWDAVRNVLIKPPWRGSNSQDAIDSQPQ